MDNNKMGKREYVDIDGKRYKFNCDVFKKAIERAAKVKSSNEKRIPKDYIISKLADEIMTSSETVRKWQSGNSPSDIDKVKDCAKILDVDYHMLLISSDNKEAHTMTENERKLIKEIFAGLIDVFYSFTEPLEITDRKKVSIIWEEHKKNIHQKLALLHRVIDKSALGTSEEIRNKLHRIIIETATTAPERDGMERRWEDIVNESINDIKNPANVIIDDGFMLDRYSGVDNRMDALKYAGNICYIWDEISLAEKYGLNDEYIVRVPEDGLDEWHGFVHELDREPLYLYDEIKDDIEFLKDEDGKLPNDIVKRNGKYMKQIILNSNEDLSEYGFTNYEQGFEPQFIYMDSIVSILEIIFTHDFPGIEV